MAVRSCTALVLAIVSGYFLRAAVAAYPEGGVARVTMMVDSRVVSSEAAASGATVLPTDLSENKELSVRNNGRAMDGSLPMQDVAAFLPGAVPAARRLQKIEEALGYNFTDRGLLLLALTHSSYGQLNNRRLHLVGAELIGLATGLHALAAQDPEMDVGDIAGMIAELRSSVRCAQDAARAGIVDCVIVGRGVK